ncbi:glycosyltransferase [Neisseria leonii]|uniref:Glycosyltransferase n=1 Tax=Neisseria leonii TaxID=2995413 RepID=A0A9X4E3X6_9NEIS|nr:glycosyltransferase [Neisseria sp. 51.81]MDD9328275.1 glycosyltransferase [Neisseria sp. 51.81]
MKIALITSLGGLGGTETATLRLGRLLVRRGHDVLLAASDGPLRAEAEAAGIRWYPADFYGGKTAYLRGIAAVAKMFRRERPDIVHCQMARVVPGCVLAVRLTSPHSRVFYHARGLNAATYPKIVPLFKHLGIYAVGNCRHEQHKLIRHGFPAARTAFTYNALPPLSEPVLPKTPRGFVMLATLSRLDKMRAVDRSIELFARLVRQGLNVRLQIAGTGSEEAALRRLADRLGVAEKVVFLGAVRDLNRFFADTDILLNTLSCTGDEGAGVGNNILEAGVFQTAVATYNAAGIAEMVEDGITGRCLTPHDDDAFAAALAGLVRDADLRARFGRTLNARVRNLCSDDAVYEATMAAYRLGSRA